MENLNQLIAKSIECYQKKDYVQSAELSRQVLRFDSANATMLLNLGNIDYLNQDYESAAKHYQKVLARQPENITALINLANVFHQQKKYSEAIEISQKILIQDSRPGVVHAIRGYANFELENYTDSITDFKQAIEADSNNFWLYNYLGQSYQKYGDLDLAIEAAWQAVELSGGADSQHINFAYTLYEIVYENVDKDVDSYVKKWQQKYGRNGIVQHAADSLLNNQKIDKANSQYVKNIFDVFADNFEESLSGLDYHVPELIAQECRWILPPDSHPQADILDAGCGTGWCGKYLRKIYPDSQLYGVDLSSGMIAKSKEKNIYNQLVEGDLQVYLSSKNEAYHLLVAADVLTYFGDLKAIFAAAFKALKKDGVFIFSVTKNIINNKDYFLHLSGRFLHSEKYLQKTLSESGFQIEKMTEVHLRNEGDSEVKGWIITVFKP